MVLPAIGSTLARLGTTAGARIGASRAATAGAGVAGGMLVDDVPLVGEGLDPTEGGGAGGTNWTLMLAIGLALVVAVRWDR